MGIFKKKSKAEKGQKEGGQKQDISISKPTPTQQPYKPKHAASDAVPKLAATGINGKRLSKEATDYASGAANFQHPLANNSNHPFAQAQSAFRSPSTPLAPYKGFNGGFNGMQRNHSAEVFTTDPDAPPLPSSTSTYSTPGQREGLQRDSSGYFTHPRDAPRSFDTQLMGNPKMALAGRDRGYADPHHSADSGYGSEGHSRAPSEQGYGLELPKPSLFQVNGSFLPELSLSDELAKEPAWSEASFGGESPAITPRAVEEKSVKGYFSRLDPVGNSRSMKFKPAKAAGKQTPSEKETPKPISVQHEPSHAKKDTRTSPQSNHLPEPVSEDLRPESSTLPQPQHAQLGRTSTPPPMLYEEPRTVFSAPVRHSTPPPQRLPEPQAQYTHPVRTSTPPPARDREQSVSQHFVPFSRALSPGPQQVQGFAPLERLVSQRSSVPAHGILEGYKVNKRGKILDEEGETIGELVEGDIIDCVRQRCNAYGEVLDDRGRVVGRVQAVDGSVDSPVMRIASPTPMHHHTYQQQQFAVQQSSPQTYQTPLSPASSKRPTRRESGASQPDVFTPAWQRQSYTNQSGFARELQDHLNSPPQSASQAVAPLDFPGNVTAVELDGSGRRSEEEEMLPIFDHSEVFMPAPFVPPRSPKRSETPSPPVEGRRISHQPQSTANSQFLSPAQAASPELQLKQSKHVSAPPVSNSQPNPAEQTQPAKKRWAASELIEQVQEREEPESVAVPTPRNAFPQASEPRSFATPAQTSAPALGSQQFGRTPAAGTVADTAFALRAAAAAATPPTITQSQEPQLEQATESALAARAATVSPPNKSSPYEQSRPQLQTSDSAFALRAAAAAGSPLPRLETQQTQHADSAPQQDTHQAQHQSQQQARRGILRSASDSSMSDLSKSYTRPTMSPVPEDADASKEDITQSPALFAYKGEIPAEDGPVSNAKLAPSRLAGAKSPPLPSFPRQAFTGGLPNGTPFAPMNSAQFSSAGGLGARSATGRQFTTGVPGPRPIPQFQSKNSFNAPLKRSPLSSQQTSPPESEEGSNDGEKSTHNIGIAQGMHSRQPSLRSMASTASKPRTYFTHGGRVTVEAGAAPPSQLQAVQKQPETEAAPSIKSEGGKRSRFSLGFGKKK